MLTRRLSRIRLRHLLFVGFTVVSSIPVLVLGVWEQRSAMEREVAAVHEKHLLVARNLTRALERYVTDVEAVFRLAAADIGRGVDSPELRELLSAFHFDHLCLVDGSGRVLDTLDLSGVAGPIPDAALAVLERGSVVFSDVMAGPRGRPTIYITTPIAPGRLVIGAISTEYLIKTQKAISFGKLGHAAIVDATGTVLAHPNETWVRQMKRIAKVGPVQRMMRGETGVAFFYSPAVELDMVAGFTTVPRTGWGAMIPQPLVELEESAREVKAVATRIAVAGVLVAALASWWLAGLLAGPVLAVTRAAQKFAAGETPVRPVRIGALAPTELRSLTESFDTMVTELSLANDALERQSTDLQATLDNMAEGITLIDGDGRLVLYNERFLELFGLAEGAIEPGMALRDVMLDLASAGEFVGVADPIAEVDARVGQLMCGRPITLKWTRPGGDVLELRGNPLPDSGMVVSYIDVTERTRAVRQIRHLARHDVLTGLPNRVLFRERLDHLMIAAGSGFTLFFLDLDDFKDVNDTLGHNVGDTLLQEVASRLGDCVEPGDTVARLGGDEFAIVHAATSDGPGVESLAKRIIDAVSAPYVVDDAEVHVGTAIGITSYPDDSRDADQLLRNADLAMYAAKARARNTFMRYRADMNAHIRARKSMEDDLRGAIEREELTVHFQPIIDMQAGHANAVEALLRWSRPGSGPVSPAEFIPLAERSGLIVPLGEWVLREACTKLREIHDAGIHGVNVAVNLSPVQLRRRELVSTVERILGETGLAPAHLDLEITETAAMHDIDAETAMLERLGAMGVRLSIDDFGTGHSSLSQLKHLPVDRIKIDGGFVRGIGRRHDEAIVTSILRLGRGFGLPVVAEQVETHEQLAFLRNQRCAEVQGYLFTPPVPAEQIVQTLRYQLESPLLTAGDAPPVLAEISPGPAAAEAVEATGIRSQHG